jgi:hypothetical protein
MNAWDVFFCVSLFVWITILYMSTGSLLVFFLLGLLPIMR